MVQGGGLWGFDGIRRTAQLMLEAFNEEKAPEDLIVRKGWGAKAAYETGISDHTDLHGRRVRRLLCIV